MFERYTEKSIKVIMLAQEESRRLGHNFVGTEQLLLGTIGEGTGIGAKVLQSMGVTLQSARIEVERLIGRGAGFVAVEVPFTPRAKSVLNTALEESRQLGHNYIGTEHLLLGLIREAEGVAARILERLDVDLPDVRNQIIRMLGEIEASRRAQIDAEADNWGVVDRSLEDDDGFFTDPFPRHRRTRLGQQDALETSEVISILRSIDRTTTELNQCINTLRQEIVTLSDRVARIEGKL
jgi:ATP-dependent Clp protease ATP-binding subunit ClpC